MLAVLRCRDLDAHPVNTLFRFGDGGSNGYRILIERSGGYDYVKFQDFKNYTSEVVPLPLALDAEDWWHLTVGWEGDGTDATFYFYVNGVLLPFRVDVVNFASMVDKINGSIYLGTDYGAENFDGDVADTLFFATLPTTTEINNAIMTRATGSAVSYWPLKSVVGGVTNDTIGTNHLTLEGSAVITGSTTYTKPTKTRRSYRGTQMRPIHRRRHR